MVYPMTWNERRDWIDLVKADPEKYLQSWDKRQVNYKQLIGDLECSESTARKLGAIALKAYQERVGNRKALKENSAQGGSSGDGKIESS